LSGAVVVVFLLARRPLSDIVEPLQVGWFFAMSFAFFVLVERQWFFM
jgi:hypothetical protein